MDDKDKLILSLLQKNGRMTASEMAGEVDLSVPAVTERIRKLTEGGVLKDFRAVLDAKKVDYDVTAYILLDMSSSSSYGDMVQYAQDNDEVLECHSLSLIHI